MQGGLVVRQLPQQPVLSQESSKLNSLKYRAVRERLGQLDCVTIRPDADVPSVAIGVFCHGFGAGGDDLVGLASELLEIAAPPQPITLVFPAAVLDLSDQGMPGGRAWWHLSIQRLLSAMDEGRYEQIRGEVPEGIDHARQLLCETIHLALDRENLDASRLLLGGFSQGAMLAMEASCLGLAQPPAQLVLYSGALICEQRWKPVTNKLKSTEILQSHGSLDPILPLQTGIWLRELLESAGGQVKFIQFAGPHTIPSSAIENTAQMLLRLASR